MKECKNCIHIRVCKACEIEKPEEVCNHFKDAADVAEVVRCKDCKYARGNLIAIGMVNCLMYRDMRKGEDFCNYGERKGGGE